MKRKPKYRGTGIFVHQQSFINLMKGDTFFDADWGLMTWNGKEWKQSK